MVYMAGTRDISYIYSIRDRYSSQMQKMKDSATKFSSSSQSAFRRLGTDTQSAQNRLKGLGKFMAVGLVASATAAAVGIGSIVKQSSSLWSIQAEAIANVNATLESTGGTVGRTLSEIEANASKLQENTFFGDEAILKNVSAQLLTFTNITKDSFDRTQSVVLDVTAKLNGLNASESSLQSTSIMLGKALNDPVSNLGALSRAGIQFTDQQKETIKYMAEHNNLAGAQSLILNELDNQYGGTAAALAQTTEGLSISISNTQGDLLEMIGKGLEPFRQTILKAKSDTLNSLVPIINKFNDWVSANKDLINSKITEYLSKAKSIFSEVAKVVGTAFNIFSKLVGIIKLLSPILIPLVAGIIAYQVAMHAAAAAIIIYNKVQAIQNALMTANPVGLVVAGIVALIAIIVIVVKHWDTVKAAVVGFTSKAWEAIKGFVLKVWDKLSSLLDNPLFTAIGIVVAPWLTIAALIIKHWDAIRVFFSALYTTYIEPVINAIVDKFMSFIAIVQPIIGALGTIFSNVFEHIKTAVTSAFQVIVDFIMPVIDKIAGGLGKIADIFGKVKDMSFDDINIIKDGGFIDRMMNIGKDSESATPYTGSSSPSAPVPTGSGGGSASADASISVYTEQGLGVEPYTPSGNLGYQMTSSYGGGM